ncbi:MAG: uroporphyrinogen decarboxylase family protein [Planctomycetes bacterium]|nr:uroporphyrinogen decarboxylase family protein [Planctomycetota bacterium]
MRLINWVRKADRRLVVPLAGFPGAQLTGSTIKQNEFNAELQYRTLYKLAEYAQPDALFMIMDLSVEANALGLPVRFPLAESASVEHHPVREIADLEQYKVIDPMGDCRVWVFLETMRRLAKRVHMPKGAYVSGPFTLAGLLMGANQIALDTIDRPDVVQAVVNYAERIIINYASALVEAGADMICILEPTASFLSPRAFAEFSGRSISQIVRHIDAMSILHICGNTTNLIEEMAATGVQGLSIGPLVNLPEAAAKVPSECVLMGNIDPVRVMVNGSPDDVRRAVRDLGEQMKSFENFIVATGCDLPPETPLGNILALVDEARKLPRPVRTYDLATVHAAGF